MEWSNYQKNIFESLLSEEGNVLISATAGSGKSTTLVECAKILPNWYSKYFLAFNKSIVSELETKLPSSTKCSTFHSTGIKILYKNGVSVEKVDTYKTVNFIRKHFMEVIEKVSKPELVPLTVYSIADVVSMRRKHIPLREDKDSFFETAVFYSIPASKRECDIAYRVWQRIKKYNSTCIKGGDSMIVDFDDMLSLPLEYSLFDGSRKDILFIDECQDMSNLQIEFVRNFVKKDGRIISVGDKYQSIYLFAGASHKSFEEFAKLAKMKLPLSVSYRCAKSIVKEASSLCSEIEPFEGNGEGKVEVSTNSGTIREGDLVVSRTTLPLVSLYFELIRSGRTCKIRGKDFEKSIKRFITKKTVVISDVKHLMQEDLKEYSNKMKSQGNMNPEKTHGYQDRLASIEVVKVFEKHYQIKTVKELKDKLKQVFDDRSQGKCVEMMTIHRSKGLEADNVYMVDTFQGKALIPSEYATTDMELIQEKNLLFVAITRAKEKFVYLKL